MPRSRTWAVALACILLTARISLADPDNETHVAGSPDFAVAMTGDAAGNIWIGSEDTGIARLKPDGGMETFSDENGLGDNNGYALACDTKGRVWVGHLNHGVSVFNGKDWKNYDSAHGPIGERVYAIAVSPKDGDVWIGTDAGLTRWSEKLDTWQHYTRAEGLPYEQTRGIAFDKDGDIYLATATDGVVIGRAADGFAKWEHIEGVKDMPMTVRGKGLPTNLTNGICVTIDGDIWVATTRGVAMSNDKGKTFRYNRGKDWPDFVEGSYAGKPPNWPLKGETDLVEDWATTISSDATGDVWVGFRGRGWQRLKAKKWPVQSVVANFDDRGGHDMIDEPRAILTNTGKTAYIARYARGVWRCDMPAAVVEGRVVENLDPAPLPKPAAALSADALAKLADQISKLPKSTGTAAYLGEDWVTQGDWVGRYGRQYTQLCGFFGGRVFGDNSGYTASITVGPHFPNTSLYGYIAAYKTKDVHSLWDINRGSRTQAEHNDGSFSIANFPLTEEGPDIWVSVNLPEGVHRVSLYFYSSDNHKGVNTFRDFPLELKKDVPAAPATAKAVDDDDDAPRPFRGNNEKMFSEEKTPTLARARVNHYWGGVYEQFLINGKGTYWIKITRNHSFCTKFQAIFIDRLSADTRPDSMKKLPVRMGEVNLPVPELPEARADASPTEKAARLLWDTLDKSWDRAGIENYAHAYRMQALRAAQEAKASPALLSAMRWPLHLWTDEDREDFKQKVLEGWTKNKAAHPELAGNDE